MTDDPPSEGRDRLVLLPALRASRCRAGFRAGPRGDRPRLRRAARRATSTSSTPACWRPRPTATRANAVLREARPDVVVYAPSMAAPPSYAVHALAGHRRAARRSGTARRSTGCRTGSRSAQATINSSQVAAVMLANPSFASAAPSSTDHGVSRRRRRRRASRPHRARRRPPRRVLRGASVLRVGGWLPGYLDVESTAAELGAARRDRARGHRRRSSNDAFAAVDADRIGSGLVELVDPRVVATARGRPMSGACGSRSPSTISPHSTNAVAATVNCHSDVLRWNPADRDHRLPRRFAPDGRAASPFRAPETSRRRSRSCSPARSRAARSTASSTPPSARPA